MIGTPSEYPNAYIDKPDEFYEFDCHDKIELSAIYSDIFFHVVDQTDYGIVLTPQCDIIRNYLKNYSDHILIARIVPIMNIFLFWVESMNKYSEDEILGVTPIDKGKTQRKGLIKNFGNKFLKNETNQYYFIPGIDRRIKSSLICFQTTECVSTKELESKNKVCVLKSPFREDVSSHFTSYICRIGTPTFEDDYLYDIIDKSWKKLD